MIPRRKASILLTCLLGSTLHASCMQDDLAPTPLHEQNATDSVGLDETKTGESGLNADAIEELHQTMKAAVEEKTLSGIVVMIERDGVVGYRETLGLADIAAKQPMQMDTLFRIYSMTKPIVAVAAMSLWEEGAFTLDEPISKHLPEWSNPKIRVRGEVVPAKTAITPRHLMTHTMGIKKGDVSPRQHLRSLESFSRELAEKPLASEPGTRYRYGHSIDVLGRYLEVIEGKSLDVILRERVLDPLGMTDTEFWLEDADDLERTAQLYTTSKQGSLRLARSKRLLTRKPKAMLGGQGLLSTTEDYARFCRMLANKGSLDGTTVLEPETIELMQRNHLKDIGRTYGLGGWADGSGLYYWGGAAGTKFWVSTSDKAFGLFMVQRTGYETPAGKVFGGLSRRALED
ncbi:MAG TPA: hypothetical protein DCX60_05235 [Phycisphaerales bacterium]|nr:hypothetical protein [Phycisphaerales bacterium]